MYTNSEANVLSTEPFADPAYDNYDAGSAAQMKSATLTFSLQFCSTCACQFDPSMRCKLNERSFRMG